MKGLFLKDLYMVRSYCLKMLLIIILFLGVFAVGSEEIAFYLVFPCMFAGILPMTILAYDEREKWDVCATALPVSKAQLVTVKYLLVPVFLAPAALLGLLAVMSKDPASHGAFLNTLSVGVTVGILAPAIILPFSFALGVEKGRLAYYGVLGLLIALGSIFASRGMAMPALNLPAFLSFPAAPPLIALVLLVISWCAAIALYQNRER